MRISRLDIEGFRPYNSFKSFDCDGDAVVLIGPNGYGKTSFFDAISWAFFGEIRRLRGSRDAVGTEYVANHFSPEKDPYVALHMEDEANRISVVRRGESVDLVENELSRGEKALQPWLRRLLLPLGDLSKARLPALERAFFRAYVLSQDRMARFIRDTNPRDRFDALASLLGVDLVRAFYRHQSGVEERLDREASRIDSLVVGLGQKLEGILDSISRISDEGRAFDEAEKADLAADLNRIVQDGVESRYPQLVDRITDEESLSSQLSTGRSFLARIRGEIAGSNEQIRRITDVRNALPQTSQWKVRREELRAERDRLNGELADLIARREGDAEALSGMQSQRNSLDRELTLAQQEFGRYSEFLVRAIEHVAEDECPVCEREISRAGLIETLRRRTQEVPSHLGELQSRFLGLTSRVEALRAEIEARHAAEVQLRRRIEEVGDELSDLETRLSLVDQNVAALGLEAGTLTNQSVDALEQGVSDARQQLLELESRLLQWEARAQFISSRAELLRLEEEKQRLEDEIRQGKAEQHQVGTALGSLREVGLPPIRLTRTVESLQAA